jgi:hypothetical protein
MRRAARQDSNHGAVLAALRQAQWFVLDTSSVGDGFFDAIVAKRGRMLFVEIKDGAKPPSRQRLTDDEVKVHRDFVEAGCEVVVLTSVEQVARL